MHTIFIFIFIFVRSTPSLSTNTSSRVERHFCRVLTYAFLIVFNFLSARIYNFFQRVLFAHFGVYNAFSTLTFNFIFIYCTSREMESDFICPAFTTFCVMGSALFNNKKGLNLRFIFCFVLVFVQAMVRHACK